MGTPTQPATFADLLQRYRRAAGLTQEELAERAHLSERGISNLERGVRRLPQRSTVACWRMRWACRRAERAAFEAAARGLAMPPAAIRRQERRHRRARAGSPLVGRTQELPCLHGICAAKDLRCCCSPVSPASASRGCCRKPRSTQPGSGWTRHAGRLPAPWWPGTVCVPCSRHWSAPCAPCPRLSCGRPCRAAPGWCACYRSLAGGPIEPLPAWTSRPDQERRLLFKAVARFLAERGGAGRHAADPG